MDENTTVAPQDEGAQVAQPTPVEQQPAGQPQEPAQEAPQDEVMDWVTKKGYDLSTPEGVRKLAESYQNAEKLATQKAQEASELKKSMATAPVNPDSTVDPTMQEFIADYKRDKMINSFKESHTDWKQHEPKMAELLSQPVVTPYGEFTRSQLVHTGFLSLEDVYVMAKGASPVDTASIKEGAKQEVFQQLANTQRAGGASTNASQSNPQPKEFDPIMEGLKKGFGR